MIMGNVPQDEKLTSPLHYFVQLLTESQTVPIEMWNVNIGIRPTVLSRFGVAN
jgi:hypothetical protein